jgi:predicted transcriptional regulator of viral defense system
MKWPQIDRALAESGFRLFSGREFRRLTATTPIAAKFLLMRYVRRGLLRRLRRGLYAAAGRLPARWAIANKIYGPSYISLASALSYYGLLPETVYSVTSVTTKSTREFEVDGVRYGYRTIKHGAFGGYRGVEIDGETVLIAEREKALADYLYFVFLKKESFNRRLDMSKVDQRKLRGCLREFGSPRLLEWYENDLPRPDNRTAR